MSCGRNTASVYVKRVRYVKRHTPDFFRDFMVIFEPQTADLRAGGGQFDGVDGKARSTVTAHL